MHSIFNRNKRQKYFGLRQLHIKFGHGKEAEDNPVSNSLGRDAAFRGCSDHKQE